MNYSSLLTDITDHYIVSIKTQIFIVKHLLNELQSPVLNKFNLRVKSIIDQ